MTLVMEPPERKTKSSNKDMAIAAAFDKAGREAKELITRLNMLANESGKRAREAAMLKTQK
jgi:hypothetical protein